MTNRAGWEVVLAIFAHPEVGGKSKDDQAKARHEGLLHKRAGNDGLRIPVDDGDLDELETDHDKAHHCREEHRPFALDEDCGCSDYHSTSYHDQEKQAWDGVVTKGCALQPCEGKPLVKDACENCYSSTDSAQTDDGFNDGEQDSYGFMFHDGSSLR